MRLLGHVPIALPLAVLALAGLVGLAHAAKPPKPTEPPAAPVSDEAWVARAEAAAVRVREQASEVAKGGAEVAQAGRVQGLGRLSTQVDELVRRSNLLVSVTGAAEVPEEGEGAP